MQEIDQKLCHLIQEITDCTIDTLKEMKTGFLLNNLLNKINPTHFPIHKLIPNWKTAQESLQNFLDKNGLEEILDFDLEEIGNGQIECMISAVFQILAIFAVFNKTGFEKGIGNVDNDTRFSVMSILSKMIERIELEMDVGVKISKNGTNSDIKSLFRKLEFQDNLLKQNEEELLKKTNEIFDQNSKIQKLKEDFEAKKLEFKNYKKRKEQALKHLEDIYYKNQNEMGNKEMKVRIEILEKENLIFKNENSELNEKIDEKDSELEKLKIMFNFYEQNKHEYEELGSQLSYYKKSMENLKLENSLNNDKLKYFDGVSENFLILKKRYSNEKKRFSTLQKSNKDLKATMDLFKNKLNISKQKIEFIKSSVNIDEIMQNNFIKELEKKNNKLSKKIENLKNKTGKEKEIEKKENSENIMVRQMTIKKIENVTTLLDLEQNEVKINKENDNMELLYSLCLEYFNDKILTEKNFVINRDERKRNIFSKFTLTGLLNN